MSQEELVGAYVEGRLSRRALIQILVAGGLTLGAASTYAALLAPEAKAGGMDGTDEYGPYTIKVLSSDIDVVKETMILETRITNRDELKSKIRVIVFVGDERIGRVNFPNGLDAGSRKVSIPLRTVGPLRQKDSEKVTVKARHTVAVEPDEKYLLGEGSRVLKKKN